MSRDNHSEQFTVNGILFNSEYRQRKRKHAPILILSTKIDSNGSFSLTTETDSDKFFKKINFSKEIQTGDSTFDNRFYIDSEKIYFTQLVISNSENRLLLTKIFDLGVTWIRLVNGKLEIIFENYELPDDSSSDPRPKVLELAAELIQNLPPSTMELSPIRPSSNFFTAKTITSFSIWLTIVGIISTFCGLSLYTPLQSNSMLPYSLRFSLPLFGVFMLMCLPTIRGASNSHRLLLINAVAGLVGFVTFCLGGSTFVNGFFDTKEQSSYSAIITSTKRKMGSNKSRSRYVKFPSFLNEGEELSVKVGISEFNSVEPGKSKINITVGQGSLGIPWIQKYEIAN